MNESMIKSKDVITVLEPDENFKEYFLNESKELEEAIEAKLNLRKLEDIDPSETGLNDWINKLEDMEISKGQLIH